jgi:transposase
MASLQRYSSNGQIYYRIVESYRRPDGKPTVRVLMHLGKAADLLARLEQQRSSALRLHSVAAGAVDAALALAQELGCAQWIDEGVRQAGRRPRRRDGLTVGESLVAAAVARLVHPSSKRAIAQWAEATSLPAQLGVKSAVLTSQHFWDQMDAVPIAAVAEIEQRIVESTLRAEQLSASGVVGYDTTNFFTHVDSSNRRTELAQRGHNKQRRHDLRQLGLALMVSEQGQIPLGHALYQGSQADVTTFRSLLESFQRRLGSLVATEAQFTLVFDQGAESQTNLEKARSLGVEYVTALKPSHHREWLAEDAGRLEPIVLSSGAAVQARRQRRRVHEVEQTVVTVFSPALYEGQCRGLEQQLRLAQRKLARISPHPRQGIEGVKQQVQGILNRQYVREVLHCEIEAKAGLIELRPWVDEQASQRLKDSYFGLRLLATTREEWTTAQIIEAYRGQSRVERAFRDLKDPWVCAFRPQYHWTDQKLIVHALIAVLSLLLGRVLLRRAQQRVGFRGSLRSLIQKLSCIRRCTVVVPRAERGRPRVHEQLEQCEDRVQKLGQALGVLERKPAPGIYG